MTTYTVGVITSYESEINSYAVNLTYPSGKGSSSSNRLQIRAGVDSIVFQNNGSESAKITSINTSQFLVNGSGVTNVSLLASQSKTLSSRSTATIGSLDAINVQHLNSTQNQKALYIEIVDPVDADPDGFTLGSNKDDVELSTWYSSNPYIIRGISDGITCRINSTTRCELWKNGSKVTGLNTSVNEGDSVYMRIKSSSAYSQGTLRTMWVGNASDSWTVTTIPDPETTGEVISHTFSGNISLDTMSEFFSGVGGSEREPAGVPIDGKAYLTDYRRSGDYVPDITGNIAIPTTGTVYLSQFNYIESRLYFSKNPSDIWQQIEVDPVATDDNHYSWQLVAGTDFIMGYGLGMTDACEFRYELLQSYVTGPDGVKTTDGSATLGQGSGTWSNTNDFARLDASIDIRAEAFFEGGVRIYARNKIDPSKVIYADFNYEVFIYDRMV